MAFVRGMSAFHDQEVMMTDSAPQGAAGAGDEPPGEDGLYGAITAELMPRMPAAIEEAIKWAVRLAVRAYFDPDHKVTMFVDDTDLIGPNYWLFSEMVPHQDEEAVAEAVPGSPRASLEKLISDRLGGVKVRLRHYKDIEDDCIVEITILQAALLLRRSHSLTNYCWNGGRPGCRSNGEDRCLQGSGLHCY